MRATIRSASALLIGLAMASAALADGLRSPSPNGAALYFIAPQNGEMVTSPFIVRFGLRGMGVAPAGINQANTGHHHLLIDLAEAVELEQPLPATDHVRHFGGGQTEAEISLPPGEHTLQLMLGNHLHIPHDPPVQSEAIAITVK